MGNWTTRVAEVSFRGHLVDWWQLTMNGLRDISSFYHLVQCSLPNDAAAIKSQAFSPAARLSFRNVKNSTLAYELTDSWNSTQDL